MTVQFRVLGDVEAQLDGQRLDIGHARQRCVLVALLVDVNRAVSAEQLIDRVWADALPHRVRNALAGYLSRLRTLFADVEDVVITREPGGYTLKTDPLAVDLHLFRQLTAQARAQDEPGDVATGLDHALQLWRGEPFATLDTPWITGVRSSLEIERLSVQLDRNDAALRAGRHADLLGDLITTMTSHPLDERVAAQLMLAQFRSGRRADALDTYRQLRHRLVEELGIDPGQDVREVHQHILDGDTSRPPSERSTAENIDTAESTPPAPSSDRRAPASQPHLPELPRRATSFVGRVTELARVTAALHESPLVTLTGVGGVGKTRLAFEAVSRDARSYPDGIWLCELAPLGSGTAVSHAIATALRLQQRQGLDIDETVIEYLRGRELLLIVDNCEHVLEPAARLLDRVVTHCPHVTVLATSREALNVSGERVLPVPPLTVDDATALFADRARASRPDFDLDHEPIGAVAEICRRLDGLPLAIELAAARMRAMNSLDVARRLDRLRLLSGGARGAHPRQQSLAATIDWSYELLDEAEQSLFARLSVFAGGFDLDAVHSVCAKDGMSEDDTLDQLTGLVDKSMIVVRAGSGRTRWTVLETLRAYGRERLRDNMIEGELALRHCAYFAVLAERAAVGMHGSDEGAWVERMLPDYDNLRAAFERAMTDGNVDLALRVVTSLSELGHLRVGYEASEWSERALALADPDHPLFAAAVGLASRGAWNRGEDERVPLLAALAAGRNPGRGNGRPAYPGDVLADVALYSGHPDIALAHYTAAMERARCDDDPIRLVWTLFYMAICYAALRTPEEGLPAAQEAVIVAETTTNPTACSMARYALGLVVKKSEPDRALALFDEAAELAASVQNFWWHGIALMEAAATRGVHGDTATAARLFIDVLDHWDRVGDWSQQWLNLRYVTRLLVRLGDDDDALALHHALVNAGKPSPLGKDRGAEPSTPVAGSRPTPLTGVEAVARARAALTRFASPPTHESGR